MPDASNADGVLASPNRGNASENPDDALHDDE
jgi:hypothetical protein